MGAVDRRMTAGPREGAVGPRGVSEEKALIPIVRAAQGCGIFVDVQSTAVGRAVRVCLDGVHWYVVPSVSPVGWVAMREVGDDRHSGPDLASRYEMAREAHDHVVPIYWWGKFLAGC